MVHGTASAIYHPTFGACARRVLAVSASFVDQPARLLSERTTADSTDPRPRVSSSQSAIGVSARGRVLVFVGGDLAARSRSDTVLPSSSRIAICEVRVYVSITVREINDKESRWSAGECARSTISDQPKDHPSRWKLVTLYRRRRKRRLDHRAANSAAVPATRWTTQWANCFKVC